MNYYSVIGVLLLFVFVIALVFLFNDKSKGCRLYLIITIVGTGLLGSASLSMSDSVNDAERCEELKKNGTKVIQDGRCYIEIAPGVYQNISGKRVRTYLESELRK